MEENYLFRSKSSKSVHQFIEDLKKNASKFDYYVRHVFNIKEEYENRNIKFDDHFNVYQVMVCKFNYKGFEKNIERLAVMLSPKQIVVHDKEGVTTILYLPFSEKFIKEILPSNEEFATNQSRSCQAIVELIKNSV
jgi:hypothetical protein